VESALIELLRRVFLRVAISKAHGVGVDEAVLAKMLLFERIGNPDAYAALTKAGTPARSK
jgi:hypothetical protein